MLLAHSSADGVEALRLVPFRSRAAVESVLGWAAVSPQGLAWLVTLLPLVLSASAVSKDPADRALEASCCCILFPAAAVYLWSSLRISGLSGESGRVTQPLVPFVESSDAFWVSEGGEGRQTGQILLSGLD